MRGIFHRYLGLVMSRKCVANGAGMVLSRVDARRVLGSFHIPARLQIGFLGEMVELGVLVRVGRSKFRIVGVDNEKDYWW